MHRGQSDGGVQEGENPRKEAKNQSPLRVRVQGNNTTRRIKGEDSGKKKLQERSTSHLDGTTSEAVRKRATLKAVSREKERGEGEALIEVPS